VKKLAPDEIKHRKTRFVRIAHPIEYVTDKNPVSSDESFTSLWGFCVYCPLCFLPLLANAGVLWPIFWSAQAYYSTALPANVIKTSRVVSRPGQKKIVGKHIGLMYMLPVFVFPVNKDYHIHTLWDKKLHHFNSQ